MAVTDVIYDDSNVEQMGSIPPDAFHRAIDLAIVQADKEGTSSPNASAICA